MWVFTTSGFVSAVYKDDAMQIRARDRKSLEGLSKQTGASIILATSVAYARTATAGGRSVRSVIAGRNCQIILKRKPSSHSRTHAPFSSADPRKQISFRQDKTPIRQTVIP